MSLLRALEMRRIVNKSRTANNKTLAAVTCRGG